MYLQPSHGFTGENKCHRVNSTAVLNVCGPPSRKVSITYMHMGGRSHFAALLLRRGICMGVIPLGKSGHQKGANKGAAIICACMILFI
jgi:hypothetical protein